MSNPSPNDHKMGEPYANPNLQAADETLRFLRGFQQLLQDSSYTTTYKFALLKALCDITIELPDGEDGIPIDAIADRMVSIYWLQARPYQRVWLNHGGSAARPARAINLAMSWRAGFGNKFSRMQCSPHFLLARGEMRTILLENPLWRLQPTDQLPLIYRHDPGRDRVRLTPIALVAIRTLHSLLSDLIESQWTRWIQRRNPQISGDGDLRDHLFGMERKQLRKVVPRLLELQSDRSLYSSAKLSPDTCHVDHFIPWSISRHDALGNLVLCSPSENIRFSDSLKPLELRDRWLERNLEHSSALSRIARETGLRWDPGATKAIAEWAYRWSC
jgi:hypothetical protein